MGYDQKGSDDSALAFYQGGNAQGYYSFLKIQEFTWIGTAGNEWQDKNNWSYSEIPSSDRAVIIPSNAPNYPIIGSDTFRIGSGFSGTSYVCKTLWIQHNATFTAKPEAFIENYGLLRIDGSMLTQNNKSLGFQNLVQGRIEIGSSGSLQIRP